MFQGIPKVEGGSQDLANMHNVFLPKIPSEHLSSQLSNQSFGRQDSLSFCATLQDADRNRQENIMDFMEREMNLDEYIGALKDLDVQPDHIDLDDTELQKTHLLYDDVHCDQYDPYAHRPELHVLPQCTSSDRSLASTPNTNFVQVKTEDELEWEYEPTTSTSTAPPRRRLTRDGLEYTPKTKARKYVLKPDEEKKNPVYKIKRARNNDAVRKSRSKQKELQAARDRELDDLRDENIELKTKLSLAEQIIAEQKQTITRMTMSRLVSTAETVNKDLQESADIYKTFFNATTPKEETCKYILAGFGTTWITLIAGVLAYWLLRRRPVPNYTYELVNEGSFGVGLLSFLLGGDPRGHHGNVKVSGKEDLLFSGYMSSSSAESQCRRRQVSEVSLSLSAQR